MPQSGQAAAKHATKSWEVVPRHIKSDEGLFLEVYQWGGNLDGWKLNFRAFDGWQLSSGNLVKELS